MSTTKKFWTYNELLFKVQNDSDMAEAEFIDPPEMVGYFNEGVDHLETIVNTMYKDYFLGKPYEFPIVSGQDEYPLPPRIYAEAIRRVLFVDGARVYAVNRLRDWHKFEVNEINKVYNASGRVYSYFLLNDGPGDVRMLFSPAPTDSGTIKVWHIRQANRFVLDINDNPISNSVALEASSGVTFLAVTAGYLGDEISLVFDGIEDIATVVAAWNLANPTNQVAHDGIGTEVPTAQTLDLAYGGSDILDIPEGHNYLVLFVKIQIMFKESYGAMTPAIAQQQLKLEDYKVQLEGTLAARVPDADNEIEADYRLYQEHT